MDGLGFCRGGSGSTVVRSVARKVKPKLTVTELPNKINKKDEKFTPLPVAATVPVVAPLKVEAPAIKYPPVDGEGMGAFPPAFCGRFGGDATKEDFRYTEAFYGRPVQQADVDAYLRLRKQVDLDKERTNLACVSLEQQVEDLMQKLTQLKANKERATVAGSKEIAGFSDAFMVLPSLQSSMAFPQPVMLTA